MRQTPQSCASQKEVTSSKNGMRPRFNQDLHQVHCIVLWALLRTKTQWLHQVFESWSTNCLTRYTHVMRQMTCTTWVIKAPASGRYTPREHLMCIQMSKDVRKRGYTTRPLCLFSLLWEPYCSMPSRDSNWVEVWRYHIAPGLYLWNSWWSARVWRVPVPRRGSQWQKDQPIDSQCLNSIATCSIGVQGARNLQGDQANAPVMHADHWTEQNSTMQREGQPSASSTDGTDSTHGIVSCHAGEGFRSEPPCITWSWAATSNCTALLLVCRCIFQRQCSIRHWCQWLKSGLNRNVASPTSPKMRSMRRSTHSDAPSRRRWSATRMSFKGWEELDWASPHRCNQEYLARRLEGVPWTWKNGQVDMLSQIRCGRTGWQHKCAVIHHIQSSEAAAGVAPWWLRDARWAFCLAWQRESGKARNHHGLADDQRPHRHFVGSRTWNRSETTNFSLHWIIYSFAPYWEPSSWIWNTNSKRAQWEAHGQLPRVQLMGSSTLTARWSKRTAGPGVASQISASASSGRCSSTDVQSALAAVRKTEIMLRTGLKRCYRKYFVYLV